MGSSWWIVWCPDNTSALSSPPTSTAASVYPLQNSFLAFEGFSIMYMSASFKWYFCWQLLNNKGSWGLGRFHTHWLLPQVVLFFSHLLLTFYPFSVRGCVCLCAHAHVPSLSMQAFLSFRRAVLGIKHRPGGLAADPSSPSRFFVRYTSLIGGHFSGSHRLVLVTGLSKANFSFCPFNNKF